MRRIDPIILCIAIFFVLALAGGIFFAYKVGGKPMEAYSQSSKEKPKAEVSKTSADMGEMSVTDVKSVDFVIKNTGTKKLQINNVSTSCDCTFAQITIGETTSQRFSMHYKSGAWLGEIEPGKEAKVIVTYEPSIMPVQGKVERIASMRTNDPENPNIAFTVTAEVK
ncbi:MAG: DUF1573 domain-containing protein [Candidatus Curtissbacteria bacterium]|nr:DUF1573 domain-containing protein [Candidatus Curtissbacteria bacterium]